MRTPCDSGPFFDFPKPVELAVRAAFRRMVRVARRDGAAGATDDELDAMLERGMFGRFLGGGAPVYRAMVRDCMEVCSFVPDASVAHEPATLCERRLPDLPPDVARRRVFPWGGEGRMASVASIFYLLLRYTTCMLAEGTE